MRTRVVGVLGAASLLVGVLAAPASAHAAFSGVKMAPADTDQSLTINVPEERDPDTHNVGVVVHLPAGWKGHSCEAAAPWHCTVDAASISWTRNADAPFGPDPEETFRFAVHLGPEGSVRVPVDQTYTNGDVVRWAGAAGSATPAPVFKVTPGAAPAPTSSDPTVAAVAVEASAFPSAAAAAATRPRTGSGGPLAAVVIGLLLVVGGGGAFLAAKRKKEPAA